MDPGFGSYWTVNLQATPGSKCRRKRERANREPVADGLNALKRGRPGSVYPPTEPEGPPGVSAKKQDDCASVQASMSGLHPTVLYGGASYADNTGYLPKEIPRTVCPSGDCEEDDE